MKALITILLTSLLALSCGSKTPIGKYQKAELPSGFTYKVLKDESNNALEKNQLTIEINQKLSIEQIATLAEKLYSSKKKQRRFYISYYLPNMKQSDFAWAISNFDPELEVEIIGSTEPQESASKNITVDGKIIGKWYEQQYVSAAYVLYEKENKLFMRSAYKDSSFSDEEMTKRDVEKGTRLESKEGNPHGEYYILSKTGTLDFYNKENKKFTSAEKFE